MYLSIILTVYNKASFLHRCFNSLLCQNEVDEGNYEIIVVNDGSTDNSSSIILQFEQQNKQIRVINQDNQGLSIARNNGVNSSSGDYVWFVDADDTIEPYAVSLIMKEIKNNPDIIPIYAKTEGKTKIRNAIDKYAKTGKDILIEGKWEQCGVFYVFRKDFLRNNGFHFFPGIFHEDAEFTPRVLFAANSVCVIPEVLYTVFRDSNSITQVPTPKRAFDYLTVAERLYYFVETISDDLSLVKKVLFRDISVDINMAFFIVIQNNCEEQHRFNNVFRANERLFIDTLKRSGIFKYQIESLLFRLLPGKYIFAYKLLKSLVSR